MTDIYDGYDAELSLYDEPLHRACAVTAGDRVLDIGCGTGHSTRRAARTAHARNAFGIDISESAIERAREIADAEQLSTVTFEVADAQTHPFTPAGFDVAISRFGTMFFDDPVAAFTNIGRAIRPGGRLAMLVWQAREHNEWSSAIARALAATGRGPGQVPDAFSLADPSTVTAIMSDAGFVDVVVDGVHAPVFYGRNVHAALDWVGGFANVAGTMAGLSPLEAEQAMGRLRDMLASRLRADGVWFDARAWLVTAHVPEAQ
ncbi:class I SAM-dependent methyltransferase [Williamsia sp. DF01-3]|uniref:class I SAM-dependent methyltransferase n=1 Tax=Williamsia sp. DF01-3 TaxID=2934157 RepID=UPI001FF12FFB|nr:class I SAM-dependent methyltransferase [Williamsia sp. DF01-3]MCK0517922.1 methyltransferase domain-containing protein [Williamsia sp. DF01-3]